MGETNRRFTTTTTLYNYIPIPRSTLKLGLPTTALIIYGLLCDRATLSRKNGYYSADGWIYAVYPVLELTEIMGMGPTAIKKNLRALENAGLIVRIRHSRKEANRFYLLAPSDCVSDTGRDTFVTGRGRKSVLWRDTKPTPSNLNKQLNISYSYHSGEESL